MSLKSLRRMLTVAVLSFAGLMSLRADVTASILGNAHDSTGATLPGVKVTVTNVNTNLQQSAVTDTSGEYRFLSLPVGTYRIDAELSGFQVFTADNIVLSVDQQRRVDIAMKVGSLQERIEVQANAVQVE